MALGPARRIASASTLALARAIPSFTHRQRIERLLGNTCAAKAACSMQKTRALYASRPLPDSPSLQDVVTMTQRSARTDKVMIVDDDARIRNLLSRYLTQEGFEVIVAEDGHALNRILLRDTVDLIVLDLVMPGEDGLSVCRRLRAANDRTPIIMLTAKGEDMHRIAGLEVGADDYLAKPFNPHELRARMRAGLRRRPPRAGPGAPSIAHHTLNFPPLPLYLLSPRPATAQEGGRGPFPARRRVRDAQGAGAPSPPAALAREAGPVHARPRVRALRPQSRRADLAPAQAARIGRRNAALHPDGVGPWLRVCAGRDRQAPWPLPPRTRPGPLRRKTRLSSRKGALRTWSMILKI